MTERTEEIQLTRPWELAGVRYEATEQSPVTVKVTQAEKDRMLKRGGCKEPPKVSSFSRKKSKASKDEGFGDMDQEEKQEE